MALVVAAFVSATCGGGGGEAPTVPPGPPGPTPTPVAEPTPEPLSASCERLGLGSPTYSCREGPATFNSDVEDAIDTLLAEHPEYFEDQDRVVNPGAYYAGLIRILDGKGLCAAFDGEELAVKETNDYNEQYRVLTSWGQIRRAYKSTCTPAWFPVARSDPAPSPPGCALPPSTWAACGRPPDARYRGDVEAALDEVMAQRPELFDFEQLAPSSDWPLVKDIEAYHRAVVDALTARGYCGWYDGEEIQVKRSNEFSEHYDINYADSYVRRGPGSFRSACYPAAF